MNKISALLTIFTLVAASNVFAADAAPEQKLHSAHELQTTLVYPDEGVTINKSLINDFNYVLSDRYVIGTTLRTKFDIRAKGDTNVNASIGYLRFYLSQSGVYRIGALKGNLYYRWAAPVSVQAQRAGGFGRLTVRADTSGTFGKHYVLIRTGVNAHLGNSAYQVSVQPGKSPEGNSLFGYVAEVYYGYAFVPEKIGSLLTLIATQEYKGGDPGTRSNAANGQRFDTMKTSWEYEINANTSKIIDKSEVALSVAQGDIALNNKFSSTFFKAKALEYSLYLRKNF